MELPDFTYGPAAQRPLIRGICPLNRGPDLRVPDLETFLFSHMAERDYENGIDYDKRQRSHAA